MNHMIEQMIDRGDGIRLAARFQPGRGPTLMFLPGYMSDMSGTKAQHLLQWAAATGRQCLLMDYSGCGASEGAFEAGSIRRWAADAKAVVDALAPGPLIPIGSSMGGWIMLHLALAEPSRIHAMVGIAAAPDFTRWGLSLDANDVEALAHQGFTTRPSAYADSPYRYSRALIEDAETACLLDGPVALDMPVRLIHGTADADVPWHISQCLMVELRSADVQLALVKGGDHRLSSPSDLALLERTLTEFVP
ncbi:alpha/beta hydrolase [Sandaracinobacter neustonicus]|uniref:Palmitoyl-protein thioesterase ABHD10, mitochondrial n=1 Tax=Sandaracinobacter neustonicus TaxID=1715348 RepID=A0A501XQ62_9SPHN|nr:alpha/beta hydrolase [Sandaracinobacter neustonicus]TPE62862.1 alpha/beta hydrolase [Sandaracinobacter neustonicus]